MPKKIDLTGQIFGEWTVIREATKEEKKNRPGAYWKCLCSCGTEKIVNGQTLRKGESKSCGCQLSQNLSKSLKNTIPFIFSFDISRSFFCPSSNELRFAMNIKNKLINVSFLNSGC